MREFRPFKFWIPEIMNRLRLPDFIMRKSRRGEIAALLKQGRRDGIPLNRRCEWYAPLLEKILSRAPKRK